MKIRDFHRSLASECPGYDVYDTHGQDIYDGKIDYRDGRWWNTFISPHSPAYYR